MNVFPSSPSSFAKLISWGAASSVGTSAFDLNTYVDCTAFDHLLVVVVNTALGGTSMTVKLASADASNGTGNNAVAKDANGNDISLVIDTAARAASLEVRTRGLRKFVSPTVVCQSTGGAATILVYGIGVRDSSEVSALSTLLAAGTYA